jgi:hypothetical protein
MRKEKPILGKFPVYTIANSLETEIFTPVAKETAKKPFPDAVGQRYYPVRGGTTSGKKKRIATFFYPQ